MENGSANTHVGISGDDKPSFTIPTVVGKPKPGAQLEASGYFGDDINNVISQVDLKRPITQGHAQKTKDWQCMEALWRYSFSKLPINESECAGVLLIDSILNPKQHRQTCLEYMFESFNVKSVAFSVKPVLNVYCSGRMTGLSVSLGHGVTQILAIYEGWIIQDSAVRNTDITG